MTGRPAPVAGSGNPGAARAASSGGGVPNGTPAQLPPNASAELEQLRAQLAQSQRDLNALKSARDRKEHELTQQFNQRYAQLQQQLEEVRLQGMTEEQRKQYEASAGQRQMQSMMEQFQAMQGQLEQAQLYRQYLQQWTALGVTPDKLDLSGDIDALNTSGWAALQARSTQAVQPPPTGQAGATQAPPAQGAPEVVPAPEVVTDNGLVVGAAKSFAEIREAAGYADDEEFYRALETQSVDPSVINQLAGVQGE